jgi:hypothetical protein
MARRLVTASAGAGGRAPAYGGLLLDAGGTLLQVARPVAETYASIGRRYGPYASNPKNPPPPIPQKKKFHRHLALFSHFDVSRALHFVKRLACGRSRGAPDFWSLALQV